MAPGKTRGGSPYNQFDIIPGDTLQGAAIQVLLVIAGYLPNLHQQIKSEVNLAMPVGLRYYRPENGRFVFGVSFVL